MKSLPCLALYHQQTLIEVFFPLFSYSVAFFNTVFKLDTTASVLFTRNTCLTFLWTFGYIPSWHFKKTKCRAFKACHPLFFHKVQRLNTIKTHPADECFSSKAHIFSRQLILPSKKHALCTRNVHLIIFCLCNVQ